MPRKTRKAPWVDRRCCDWDTFLISLMAAAQHLKFPLLLVNRCEARRFWRRHGCTGAEVIIMQRARELDDALYNGYGLPPQGGDGGSNGPKAPDSPRPKRPVLNA